MLDFRCARCAWRGRRGREGPSRLHSVWDKSLESSKWRENGESGCPHLSQSVWKATLVSAELCPGLSDAEMNGREGGPDAQCSVKSADASDGCCLT